MHSPTPTRREATPPLKSGPWHLIPALALLSVISTLARADPFPDRVVSFNPAPGATFGQAYFPDNVLGPPEGGPSDAIPQEFPQHVLSLGHGGSIELAFDDNTIFNGPGPDFIIFENTLVTTGTEDPFIECATVEVSTDGTTWLQFPFDYIPPTPPTPPQTIPFITTANFPTGFAGLTPTRSNSTNGIPPWDPSVSGGDAFDLSTVGLPYCNYIRITDGGLQATASQRMDTDGDIIIDDGDFPPLVTGPSQGFDLDAIVGIHTTTPVTGWEQYR